MSKQERNTAINPLSSSYIHPLRVYYEDTDAEGIVYYANYLKYAERARTEMLRMRGVEQRELAETEGIVFVVKDCALQFKAPGFLDDLLQVSTYLQRIERASIFLKQWITRDDHLLVSLDITLVCVDRQKKPVRIPQPIKDALMPLETKEL